MNIVTKQGKIVNEYVLGETGLTANIGKSKNRQEFKINYEDVQTSRGHMFKRSRPKLVLGIIMCIAAFFTSLSFSDFVDPVNVTMFLLFASIGVYNLVAFIMFPLNYTYVSLDKEYNIILYKNRTNQKEIEIFIENLYQKRNKYLKERYAKKLEGKTAKECINIYNWLDNEGVISYSEYEELVKAVKEHTIPDEEAKDKEDNGEVKVSQ